MMRIKKDDIVSVIAGKDKGKKGKVLRVFPQRERVIVEGVNFLKRHVRKKSETELGGIIQREGSVHASNLMLYCNRCNSPVRIGIKLLKDRSKVKFCKKCKETI